MAAQTSGDVVADVVATGIPGTAAHPRVSTSDPVIHVHGGLQPGRLSTSTADVEAIGEKTASAVALEQNPAPTEEQTRSLRKVADRIPTKAYLLCVVEFAERASYYGVKTVFSNFMQFPLPKGGNGAGAPPKGTELTAGALGRGIQFSVAIGLLFTFLAFVIPIPGGWLADAKLGRFKTILLGVLICGISHAIMIVGAIPSVLQAGNGMAPFMISLILLAVGAGLFKPNVAPAILDQYQVQKPYVKTLGTGEHVIVDPEVTVQRTMLIFYGLINVGAFFPVATVYCEKLVGFWLAFLLPGIIFFLLPTLLWYLNNKLVKYPPDGSALTRVYKIVKTAVVQSKGKVWKKAFLDGAKPSVLEQNGVAQNAITWTDKDVDDVKRTFVACGIFLYYPIYNLNDNGIGSVQTSQGATMITKGTPNDLLGHFNALTIVFAVPLLSYVIYPLLRRFNIKFGRVSRITFGFSIAAFSGVLGALVQWKIYQLSPCGKYATTCDAVANISIWWQIPNISLGALSECFCNVTAYELAYARSPPGMKALVTSLFLFTTALSSALGEILTPAIKDPNLVWIWAAPAIVLAVQTVVFWIKYRKYDDDEFMTEETAEHTPDVSSVNSVQTTRGKDDEKL